VITRLAIFDFDGTLFNAPEMPGADAGWYDSIESLSPPCVPQRPTPDWYIAPAASAFKKVKGDPKTHVAVITGRVEPLRKRVAELLRIGGLVPDDLFLRSGGVTLPYKMATIRYLTKMLRGLQTIEIWEDHKHNLEHMVRYANKMGYASVPHLVRVKRRVCPSPVKVALQSHLRRLYRNARSTNKL